MFVRFVSSNIPVLHAEREILSSNLLVVVWTAIFRQSLFFNCKSNLETLPSPKWS